MQESQNAFEKFVKFYKNSSYLKSQMFSERTEFTPGPWKSSTKLKGNIVDF
jgi:hypothetical protein